MQNLWGDDEDKINQATTAAGPLDDNLRSYLMQKYALGQGDPEAMQAAKDESDSKKSRASIAQGIATMFGPSKVNSGYYNSLRADADQGVKDLESQTAQRQKIAQYLIGKDDNLRALAAKVPKAERQEYVDDKGNTRVGTWNGNALSKSDSDPITKAFKAEKGDKVTWSMTSQVGDDGNYIMASSDGRYKPGPKAGLKPGEELAKEKAGDKAPSEAQLTSANFGRKAQDADDVVKQFEAKDYDPSSYMRTVRGILPGGITKSDDDRGYEQAQKEFIAAILRKESGGAITPDEFSEYGSIYFPKAGDGPDVIKQKAAARKRATDSLIAQAGDKAAGQIPNHRFEVPDRSGASGTATAAPAGKTVAKQFKSKDGTKLRTVYSDGTEEITNVAP